MALDVLVQNGVNVFRIGKSKAQQFLGSFCGGLSCLCINKDYSLRSESHLVYTIKRSRRSSFNTEDLQPSSSLVQLIKRYPIPRDWVEAELRRGVFLLFGQLVPEVILCDGQTDACVPHLLVPSESLVVLGQARLLELLPPQPLVVQYPTVPAVSVEAQCGDSRLLELSQRVVHNILEIRDFEVIPRE